MDRNWQPLTSAKSFILCVGSKTLRTNPAKSTFTFSYFLIKGCKSSCIRTTQNHQIVKKKCMITNIFVFWVKCYRKH